MDFWQEFHGPNAGYVLELYDRFRADPTSVDPALRAAFERWSPPADGLPSAPAATSPAPPAGPSADKIMGAVNLANAIREYGHLAAAIDPLGLADPPGDPALHPSAHGLSDADLRALPAALIGGPFGGAADAHAAITQLRGIYSATIGYDYDHIRLPEERAWLREAAETRRFRPPNDPLDPRRLLEQLTKVEAFEQFLHRIFPGKTRFSVEGLDMMVPMLDVMLNEAAEAGIYTILIGMAHRGRLNVLAHILNKSYAEILQEFRDTAGEEYGAREYLGWTGDVKYHAGASRAMSNGDMVDLVVTMAPNPSHLEHVNPVIAGMARAAGSRVDQPGRPFFDPHVVLPITIHGDAAFPGQGIVAETLNLQRLRGYRVGGTIHVIANNQIGFTTSQWESRSTLYASDLAKGFKAPIVHVNADDPEACVEVARLACAYRREFHTDFVIDLVGYRRYGHNEGDEPRFTQPQMYSRVDKHPTTRRLWATALAERGDITADQGDRMLKEQLDTLNEIFQALPPEPAAALEPQLPPPPAGAARQARTAVAADKLIALNEALLRYPPGFTLNKKLARTLERRRDILADPDAATIDWATAETLAFASILADGVAVRLTGEDVERGTFSQRHALLRDDTTGAVHIPLQQIPQARAAFEVRNSPLSEAGVIGFEYGYSIQAPERLVVWEAQYGDFINTAQAIIDAYVTSGNAKWELKSSLVLLLPHGYEGQGPDHSTGRLERFLQAAAETNIRVANATTAAQYFHLLRRQAELLTSDPLPLIVMTPKSLLRNPLIYSALRELAEGRWQPVIDDAQAAADPAAVRRIILCSGKVYVDMIADSRRAARPDIALARVEQLYPFPAAEVTAILQAYPGATEVVWLQEEPANAGAWDFIHPRLQRLLDDAVPLRLIARPRRAAPAEGSMGMHSLHQKTLLDRAYELADEVSE
ncbi:2-oxoglutarate decarboxylase, thiamin-requiring [Candidatus Promineifilum breve]|uniref:oxoglutarate dehydrogenase (succinyl-transferring) n=1 Tax=Candidatus Promineifilum breve TaxID=1806508 RepID=A0A160T595_9CHLR|nr:2-oxoglutarate dehydrogenase E1 component [Candidatus Promineifilum breve]CUS05531.2 2-oxoglutarate decarboxylase, thiamin-requiring [Candidatus Promineifilum breve]